MRKIFLVLVTTSLCILTLSSCASGEPAQIAGEWHSDVEYHWKTVLPFLGGGYKLYNGEHSDTDIDGACDVCGCTEMLETTRPAEVVLQYEAEKRAEIDRLNEENPEYIYYYHPSDRVYCVFFLEYSADAEFLIDKYSMRELFKDAEINSFDALPSISMIFDPSDFTEFIHRKAQQITDTSSAITGLLVDVSTDIAKDYVPNLEYYAADAVALEHELVPLSLEIDNRSDVIIEKKEQCDAFWESLAEKESRDPIKELLLAQKDAYDEGFFEDNALIITKTIHRSSSPIELTVEGAFASGSKLYVVVKTLCPAEVNAASQRTNFILKLSKSDLNGIDEVITLE